MKGIIVINPFGYPNHSVKQAERLKEEFNKKGVEIEIVKDGFSHFFIDGKALKTTLDGVNFAIFLDKDKYLSKELEILGVKMYNSHNAIRTCDDKGETYIALSGKGISIPDTIFGGVCYLNEDKINPDFADRIIEKLSLPVVVKESYGSMGKGVYLAKDKDELLSVAKADEKVAAMIDGKTIVKEIVVPNKIVNIVVK